MIQPSGDPTHPRWRRGDEQHGDGRGSVSASVTPLSLPLRRVTRGRKRPDGLAPAATRETAN